ncbi:Coenzyme F420 hydrogenase/dehydrogenase, beta subunit C-terminal domain [Butyrivibrio fibrisolvens]|uniref:Coenzyme F420 hydrogenase/dehydrogenase, beta subunit C-terminal domain n=1 Tax=Pseudobutyrivibrio ruminis TaxID=46206 RepID=UPI0003FD4886|nr:Coenzyme F420 hydrogenase/dehydrogenase, beta subunit C-terminal domain [Pseudobutyrivibrio ruminis]MDC7280520.1 Coenzyme F420 hydrogenase/dehydrogenase, beta subunit C-terminal domain [Butyrivibrio fibrisolvens]
MTVCDIDKCAGCMLCIDVCKKEAIHIEDNMVSYNAVIDEDKCVNCNACHKKCPQNNTPEKISPISWYQGWNRDDEYRSKAPSGGIGMALAKQFIKDGGYVCSCLFKDGDFYFDITNDYEQALKFGGSKYVKSNPVGIYPKVLEVLKAGNKVLFIGLPCQIAAVKAYVGAQYQDRLYTVDLICHGTPSPKILELFLKQYSKSLKTIKDIKFRLKTKMQLVVDDKGIVCKGVSDKYTIAFLDGLTYTSNCYSCKYASRERISDITIGDSWGTKVDAEEIRKGVSLMVVQTEKGEQMLKNADIELLPVDVENAVNNNEQLSRPMSIRKNRSAFFELIKKKSFNHIIFNQYKSNCLKQDVKLVLIKLGLVH